MLCKRVNLEFRCLFYQHDRPLNPLNESKCQMNGNEVAFLH